MGLREVNTVDIVTESPSGGQELWIVESQWAPEREALDFVELIIKLTNVESYVARLRDEGTGVTLRVHSLAEPPVSVVEFLRSRGVTATTGLQPDSFQTPTGRPARHPNLPGGDPDIDALQAANAGSFAVLHRLDGSVESVAAVDRLLERRRREEGLGPGDADEELEDGDLMVLAGAYVGEVIRRAKGGHWTIGPAGPSSAVHVLLGRSTRVNTLGKVRKYLKHGSVDSLQPMVSGALSLSTG